MIASRVSRVLNKRISFVSSRSIFINTETTPNPNSIKFLPGEEVLPEKYGSGKEFQSTSRQNIQYSPLATNLFDIDGINGVYLGRDFISVTKAADYPWSTLKPMVFSTIFDFFSEEDNEVMLDHPVVSDTAILDSDDEVVATIKELLESKIRPYVQDDGGDIFFVKFDEETGFVHVRLAGSCVGCPSSSITLRNGVENMLTHYIPEVRGIVDETSNDVEEDQANDRISTDRSLKFKPSTKMDHISGHFNPY